jgi:hypothetical protein
LLAPFAPGEREDDGEDEDGDHQDDHDEVRERHLNEAPMDVVAVAVQIDERREWEDKFSSHTRPVNRQLVPHRGSTKFCSSKEVMTSKAEGSLIKDTLGIS